MTRGRDIFLKYKVIIYNLVRLISFIPKPLIKKVYVIFRDKGGFSGLLIRYVLVKSISISCGDNVSIYQGVYLYNIDNLSLGSNVSIHPMCYIDATGGIDIGDDVSIAHGVTIMSTNHVFKDLLIPIKDQGLTHGKVYIKNNVWIGAKATILSGITVSSGSIIAAAAVVTKDVDSNQIVGGNPARVIKVRE